MKIFGKLKDFFLSKLNNLNKIFFLSIATVPMTFSDYYTKTEVDEKVNTLVTSESSPSYLTYSPRLKAYLLPISFNATNIGQYLIFL